MNINQKSEGRTYGTIGATVEKAIKEYLDKEENSHEIIFTKKTNSVVDVRSDRSGRHLRFTPFWEKRFIYDDVNLYNRVIAISSPDKNGEIFIRAGNNSLKARIRFAGEEIDNETVIWIVVEDKETRNNREFVGQYFYEDFKNGITIKNEVHITVDRALAIYIPYYPGDETNAENVALQMHLYRGNPA
jgi:hypothetical protein